MKPINLVSARIVGVFAVMGLLLLAGDARADRRVFGFSYPYQTLPQGGFEIEHYLDAGLDRFDDPSTDTVVEDSYRALRPRKESISFLGRLELGKTIVFACFIIVSFSG